MDITTELIPRPEYPRPDFVRDGWENLNGLWDFGFDDRDEGLRGRWYRDPELPLRIQVPFSYTCARSGVDIKDQHDIVWYAREFTVPSVGKGERRFLRFGAVDYAADVWVNGEHVAHHEGGHVPFSAEISRVVRRGTNRVVLRARDESKNLELPRGKQYWKDASESIFYTRTVGIWQTVWLETVGSTFLDRIRTTPNTDSRSVAVEYFLDGPSGGTELEITISLRGVPVVRDTIRNPGRKGRRTFNLDGDLLAEFPPELIYWTPGRPNLFDLNFRLLRNGRVLDTVSSYFGYRKVSAVDGRFLLNDRPFYPKMLLAQGYWEESLLTPPSDAAIIADIELSKAMGFNGVRIHQKVEDPRFLYWADRLGLLIWAEAPNAYVYSEEYARRFTAEWMAAVDRDYNHPSIVAWVPLNESWGVDGIMNAKDQQSHATSLYWLTKSLDTTRLVISNDGWEHTISDLLTIHDYQWNEAILRARYASMESILAAKPAGRGLYAQGWSYRGEPVVLSEFGGISFKKGSWDGWGYSTATDEADFEARYAAVISAVLESPNVAGFVYTQLCDVEQEINGLLTYDRKPKIDPERIRRINEGVRYPGEAT